jgi:HlyD family secretion protein
VQINPPDVIAGEIVAVGADKGNSGTSCEIKLSAPVPSSVAVGKEVGALIEIGEMTNVIFFARPADASADSEAYIFVIEPSGDFARRVKVRYGQLSGPLIQVIHGLSPGDRVVVTDMSKWKGAERVRLQ